MRKYVVMTLILAVAFALNLCSIAAGEAAEKPRYTGLWTKGDMFMSVTVYPHPKESRNSLMKKYGIINNVLDSEGWKVVLKEEPRDFHFKIIINKLSMEIEGAPTTQTIYIGCDISDKFMDELSASKKGPVAIQTGQGNMRAYSGLKADYDPELFEYLVRREISSVEGHFVRTMRAEK